MAKVSFTKLGLKINQEVKNIEWNEQLIEVKQYLPIEQKIDIVSKMLELSYSSDVHYSSPIKEKVFLNILILENYTNINFTDKQKEDPAKLYDLVSSTGLIDCVFSQIPEKELKTIFEEAKLTSDSIYKYQNSIMGILDTIGTNYSTMDLDISQIMDKIQDPESLTLLKDVLTKLG